MNNNKLLYSIIDGKINEIPITKETCSMYYFERSSNMCYRTQLNKKELYTNIHVYKTDVCVVGLTKAKTKKAYNDNIKRFINYYKLLLV